MAVHHGGIARCSSMAGHHPTAWGQIGTYARKNSINLSPQLRATYKLAHLWCSSEPRTNKVDSSVVLVTMCLPAANHMGPPEPSLLRRARTAVIKNHDDYAYKHGYMTRLHTEMPQCSRSTAWLKLPVMFLAIAQPLVKYAFWADCDVIFLNFLLPLPLPVSQLVDGVFSAERGLSANFPSATCNTGAFLLRASPWALRLLITAWMVHPVPSPGRWWEQSAFIYLFTGEQPACRASILEAGCRGRPAGPWSSRVSILPPEVIGAGIWHLRGRHPNPLLVHLMGDIYGSSEDKATILISVAKTRNAHPADGDPHTYAVSRYCTGRVNSLNCTKGHKLHQCMILRLFTQQNKRKYIRTNALLFEV